MPFKTVQVHESDVKPACVFESIHHAGLGFNERKCYCKDEINLLSPLELRGGEGEGGFILPTSSFCEFFPQNKEEDLDPSLITTFSFL